MSGRHRRRRRGGGIWAASAAVIVVATVGTGASGYRLLNSSSSCARQTLSVAAAPEIAPAVQDAASAWTSTGTAKGCVTVTVIAADPAEEAAAIAGQQGVLLPGLVAADARVRVPNVWIPDSSTWLARLRGAGTGLVPMAAPSLAESPVVLAVPQPIAAALGWAGAPVPWASLLGAMNTETPLKAGILAPDTDSASLTTLLRLQAVAAAGGQAGQDATVAALRALAANRSTVRADLLARFPRAGDATTLAESLAAAPLPEQSVLAYNAGGPPVPLTAVTLSPAPDPLDYPYAVLPGTSAPLRAIADRLHTALAGSAFRDRLASIGLRAPDGTTGAGFPATSVTAADAETTTSMSATTSAIEPELIDQTLSSWATLTRAGRILAVVDVSGSMLTPVPTAGGATREQVTIQAAASGLSLFDDSWDVGLWVFATNMDGASPYRQLVPIVPLADQRPRLRAALGTVTANPRGNTALYETILAAYRTVQEGWDANKVNSVVLITDGLDDNRGGMTLNQLAAQLHHIVDPARPIQLIVLGIGTQVPRQEIQKITQITGGGVFIATDPATIGRIFLQAIALRPVTGN